VDGRLVCTPKRYYMLQTIHFSTGLTKKNKKNKKIKKIKKNKKKIKNKK